VGISGDIIIDQLDEAIYAVRINRPPHNFFDLALIQAIASAYESIGADPKARAIVLASEGKNFCAGANFTANPPGTTAAASGNAGENAVYTEAARLIAAPLPVVAAVRGAAVGGGLGLACSADFRVGSHDTRLTANFAQLGFHHGFGLTVTLPPIVGQQRAHELLLTGKRIDGMEGYRIGLLDRLVDNAEIEVAAIEFAREIASSAPRSIRTIRATMREGLVERFRAATDREGFEQAKLRGTRDFREGVQATAERRPPVFTGE
jgi:enoyl-CoA hydratase/carnithine racemase